MQALFVSAAVGLYLSTRSPEGTASAWMRASETALNEATRNNPSSIRAYSAEMGETSMKREALMREAFFALDNGEISP